MSELRERVELTLEELLIPALIDLVGIRNEPLQGAVDAEQRVVHLVHDREPALAEKFHDPVATVYHQALDWGERFARQGFLGARASHWSALADRTASAQQSGVSGRGPCNARLRQCDPRCCKARNCTPEARRRTHRQDRARRTGESVLRLHGSLEAPLTLLADLQRQGLVRHIGLSNVTLAQGGEARRIAPVVCVQNL
jgi:hypothetical protein